MWAIQNKIINGLFFKQTCVIAPEQYDVFLDEKYVAYVRCRFGKLKVNPVNEEIIIPNVINITDRDFEKYEDKFDMYGHTEFNNNIYFKEWPDDPYKSDIPEEEFSNISDAIYKYLNVANI
jgi:hypothetical protein